MSERKLTIRQAAEELGVSPRQVRRYIQQGRIEADLAPGKHGVTYFITAIPPSLSKPSRHQPPALPPKMAMDMVRDLQRENLRLAHQLGMAEERIRALEGQVKLITAGRIPWWKRIFRVSPPSS